MVLLILLLLGGARAGEAGLQVGLSGVQGSARHRLQAQGGAWWAHAPRPWGVVGEVAVSGGRSRTSTVTYSELRTRLDAAAGLALGTRATTFHAGLGPALVLDLDRVAGGEADTTALRALPGLRLRVGLGGPVAGRLAWAGHLGSTTHLRGTDLDAAIGLGLSW